VLNNYIPLLLMRISGSSFNRRHKIFLELIIVCFICAGLVMYEMIVFIGRVIYQGSYLCIFPCRWGRVCPLPLILLDRQLIAT
jgi:hypothetical protein